MYVSFYFHIFYHFMILENSIFYILFLFYSCIHDVYFVKKLKNFYLSSVFSLFYFNFLFNVFFYIKYILTSSILRFWNFNSRTCPTTIIYISSHQLFYIIGYIPICITAIYCRCPITSILY